MACVGYMSPIANTTRQGSIHVCLWVGEIPQAGENGV